ncbi:MAG: hypothetical protein Q9M28_10765 [Mariprofundaceae bacterium]|nr:hypothetical protein [Mariprofundaceae bacterium]
MSDLDTLRDVLKQEAIVPITQDKHGKNVIILKEPACDKHDGYAITIHQIPSDIITIKADLFPAPKHVFTSKNGSCKRADFIMISEQKVIFIELKNGKGDSEAGIIQQFKGAQCVLDYCRSIAKYFWNTPKLLNKHQHRFVSIRDISVSKKMNLSKQNNLHDQPERMLKITSPHHVSFQRISC